MVQHVLLEKCPPVYRNLLHFLELHLTFHQNMIHPDHGGGQWKKVFRILIEAETHMISLMKHHMLISLRELSFACPHPKKAPNLSLAKKPKVGSVFVQLATNLQTVDFLKQHVDRLQQGQLKNMGLRWNNNDLTLPWWICLVKSRGTSSEMSLHIHPSIRPSIHQSMCDMFWGAKCEFAYFASSCWGEVHTT